MMNYLLKLLILLTFLTASKQMTAEKTFHVKIQITSGIESKSFFINYDDGVKSHLVVDSFNNNMLEFHGKFSSQYATLTIKYTVNDSLSYDDSPPRPCLYSKPSSGAGHGRRNVG